jgi:hypothetical protein
MANEQPLGANDSWPNIIKAIRTPLAFFVLVPLVSLAFIGIAVTILTMSHSGFSPRRGLAGAR